MAWTIHQPSIVPNKAYAESNALTSGTNAGRTVDLNVSPSSNSTQVAFAERVQVNYTSAYNQTVGGYISAGQDVVNTSGGSGTHDKIVGRLCQINLLGGNVTSVLGYESEIATIGAATLVGGYAAFFVPNLSGVPNIGNISQFGSFICQHVNSYSMNYGQTFNGQGIEIAPPYHPGIVANRYYSAPHDNITTQAMAANVAYAVPVFIPERLTSVKLGFTVTAGAGNARISLWTAKGGTFSKMMAQSNSFSVATTGDKEQTLSTTIDAGCYFIVAVFDSTPTLNWHSMLAQYRVWQYGAPASNTSGSAHTCAGYMPLTFGAFPSTNSTELTYQNIQIEPHFWFRV
jgi:hypothetical protein